LAADQPLSICSTGKFCEIVEDLPVGPVYPFEAATGKSDDNLLTELVVAGLEFGGMSEQSRLDRCLESRSWKTQALRRH